MWPLCLPLLSWTQPPQTAVQQQEAAPVFSVQQQEASSRAAVEHYGPASIEVLDRDDAAIVKKMQPRGHKQPKSDGRDASLEKRFQALKQQIVHSRDSNVAIAKQGEVPTAAVPAAQDKEWCYRVVATSKVVSGWSWGSLTKAGIEEWASRGCDAIVPPIPVHHAGDHAKFCYDDDGKPLGNNLIECNRAWCQRMTTEFNVVSDASWGTLPQAARELWDERGCTKDAGRSMNVRPKLAAKKADAQVHDKATSAAEPNQVPTSKGSTEDADAIAAQRAKHDQHLKHVQHAHHVQHVHHAQHAKRAERMPSSRALLL